MWPGQAKELSCSFPRTQGGEARPQPLTQPAGILVIPGCQGHRGRKRGKGLLGLCPPAGRAKPSSAEHGRSQASREAVRGIRRRETRMVTARPLGPARGAGQRGQLPWWPAPGPISQGSVVACWAGGPGSSSAGRRRSPKWGYQGRGQVGWEPGSEPSGVGVREQLRLVVQEELGEGVDGVDGLEGDGSILGPQQVGAEDHSQVGVGHLVLVTVGRNLH